MALGLAEYERADPTPDSPPPVGAIIAATFIALFVGFGSAMFLRDRSLGVAWAVAALVGLALALATRTVSNGSVTRLPVLLWTGLAVGMFAILMVVGIESIPPTKNLGLWLLMAVSIFAGACAAPVLIILCSGRRVPVPRDLPAPPLITAALGWCSAIVLLIALLITYPATLGLSPGVQIVSLLIVAIGVPVVSVVPWTCAYERIISWWAVDPPPQLTRALGILASRSGFRFDRVVCLQASYGAGSTCEVIRRLDGSTLVMSESVVADLDVEPLVAVLAHEAAHIRLHHLRRKLLFGALASIVVIGSSVTIQLFLFSSLPQSLRFVIGILPVILLGNLASQLYNARISRRHEAEADTAAVAVAGADALCRALDALGGGPSERWVHRRWTTHGTYEERMARIRSLERQSE